MTKTYTVQVNLDETVKDRFRHAGLDPASVRLLEYWIPAFAGMTQSGSF